MQHALFFIVVATTARIRDGSLEGKTPDAPQTREPWPPLPFVLELSVVSGPAEKKKTVPPPQEGKAHKKRQSLVGGNANSISAKDGYRRDNEQRLSVLRGECSCRRSAARRRPRFLGCAGTPAEQHGLLHTRGTRYHGDAGPFPPGRAVPHPARSPASVTSAGASIRNSISPGVRIAAAPASSLPKPPGPEERIHAIYEGQHAQPLASPSTITAPFSPPDLRFLEPPNDNLPTPPSLSRSLPCLLFCGLSRSRE